VRQWLRSHLTYANVMVTILAFIVLGGGTALAAYVVSSNSEIGPGTVSGHKPPSGKHSNIIEGSVNGQDLAANSVMGSDVNESSLGRVPSALLGGFGRSTDGDVCDPENPPGDFFPCAVVTLDVPRQARFFVTGQALATREDETGTARGTCRIGTTGGPIPGSDAFVTVDAGSGGRENFSIAGVTDLFPPGEHSFGIDCKEHQNGTVGILYFDTAVTAVAISPG
jgi:hypothetical protein